MASRNKGWFPHNRGALMKKILLGSSALVAAGLLVAPASAEVVNGNALQLKVTGNVQFQAAYAFDEDAADDRKYEFRSTAEMSFVINGKSDTGLTYGGLIDFDQIGAGSNAANSSRRIDEVFVEVGGDSWGLVRLGDDDDAMADFEMGVPSVGTGLVDGDYPDFLAGSGPAVFLNPWGTDATKVKYTSPKIGGFSGAVSYAVSSDSFGRNVARRDTNLTYENEIAGGLGWQGEVGQFTAQLGGGYVHRDSVQSGIDDFQAWQVSGIVGFGDISVGAEYVDIDDAGPNGPGPDYSQLALGVGYSLGSWSFAGQYFKAGKDYDDDAWAVGAEYAIAPGLSTALEFVDFDADNPDADNDGQVLFFRTRVSF
jgi:outer membrane protein OmpU